MRLYRTLPLLLCLFAFAHDDDPKLLDRQEPRIAPAFRLAVNGKLGQPAFPAEGVELLSWLPLNEFGAFSAANDCWGYVSPSGREYAIIGLSSATAFVEVSQPDDAQIVAVKPGPSSSWRDIKTYQHYAYAVSEGGSGVQVFDLEDIDDGVVTLVNTITEGGTQATHNVAIDTDSGFLYRCGGSSNGLRIYSLANPAQPTLVAQWQDRYVHDAQPVTYTTGPHAGRQIVFACAGFNGGSVMTGLSILDVTDKQNIQVLSHLEYPVASYSHQGWLSADQNYFYLNDELDESDNHINTTTHVIDIHDFSNPFQTATFSSGVPAIDHNLYTVGNLIFEANYRSGLRIFDATNPTAPTPFAYFDTYPEDNNTRFNGLWSNYPFFPSGTIIGSDIERGLFVWRLQQPNPLDLNGDGVVNNLDFGLAVDEWDKCCGIDFNESGRNDILDLITLENAVTGQTP